MRTFAELNDETYIMLAVGECSRSRFFGHPENIKKTGSDCRVESKPDSVHLRKEATILDIMDMLKEQL